MITEKDLEIANTSYINKDFQTIYPELLELTEKLTNLWSPSTSNESDPGLVLLKLGAFLGDKLNYNIDKNTLENYMPSATQESSMWKLCDMMGYPIKYYISATLPVYISLSKSFSPSDNVSKEISFDPLSLTISNSDNTIVYTITDHFTLSDSVKSVSVNAIEGSVQTLTISGNENETLVQLANLDDNNRVYFPETNVAQNGIFIEDAETEEFWSLVDNLNTVEPLTQCFKFGYDSIKGFPYIEFPTYISEIIGQGLTIKYIISSGNNGNVKARTLNSITYVGTDIANKLSLFNVDSESATINDILSVSNNYASLNGSNPQSIDEAYEGFKKTIGTFDTLVTSRDYANAIYNLKNEVSGNPIVSNCQVADRRTDINYSNNIITFKITDNDVFNISTNNFTDNTKVTPYDLTIYPLKPLSTTNKTIATYDTSYTRLNDITYITNSLENSKSISHNYKDLDNDDIYAILNKYSLNAIITTNKKVNAYESALILDNINLALINNFNARKLDYGEEIPYDLLLECIQNADKNIKNVSLAEPTVTPYLLSAGGDVTKITKESNEFKTLCVKNVLAGRVPLFDIDSPFQYSYTQSDNKIYSNVKSLDTFLNLTWFGSGVDNLTTLPTNYTLRKNEMIQFLTPLYNETIKYSSGVKYKYYSVNSQNTIAKGSVYELVDNDYLQVTYTSSGSSITQKYTAGTLIKPSFNLAVTGDTEATISISNTISIVEKSEHIFNSKLNCYWILNNIKNIIPWTNNTYTLQDGEYFIYTNSDYSALSVLGSGTKLTRSNDSIMNDACNTNITISDITNNGLTSFDIFDWVILDLNASSTLTITDNQIISLGEGDTLISVELLSPVTTEYTLSVGTSIKGATYKIKNETNESSLSNSSDNWRAYPRLNINCGTSTSQTLSTYSTSNSNISFSSNQLMDLNFEGTTNSKRLGSITILFSKLIQRVGGTDIDVREYKYDETTEQYTFKPNLSVMSYTPITQENLISSGDYYTIAPDSFTEASSKYSFELKLPSIEDSQKGTLMIYIQDNIVGTIDKGTNLNTKSSNLQSGINCIYGISGDSIIITLEGKPTSNVVISKYTPYKLNANLPTDIITSIQATSGYDKFYFNHPTITAKEINEDDLVSANAYWDYNNIANKMTIAKIDFGNSKISISKSSRI